MEPYGDITDLGICYEPTTHTDMCNGYAALNISATESNVENISSENSGYDSRNITTVNSYEAQTNNESANTESSDMETSGTEDINQMMNLWKTMLLKQK